MSENTKDSKTWLYVLIGVFLLFELFVLCRTIEYSLWQQVDYLWNTEYATALPALKNHFLRYWLVLPIYWASSISGYSTSILFSVLVPVIIGTATLFIHKTKSNRPCVGVDDVLVFVALSLLSLAMNGRMIFVFLGTAILIYCTVTMITRSTCTKKNSALVCMSLWLMAVSSGTLAVAYVYVLLFLIFSVARKSIRCSISQVFVISTILLFFGAEVIKFVVKNLAFYGEGVEAVAEIPLHGAGKYMGSTLGLVTAMACCLAAVFVLLKAKKVLVTCSGSLLLLGLAGGVFGLSTLTSTVVPVIVVVLHSAKVPLGRTFLNKGVTDGES